MTTEPLVRNLSSMTLRGWLEDMQMTQTELAESLGVSVATVSRWVNGEQSPRIEQALALETLTGGKVGVREWAGDKRRVAG